MRKVFLLISLCCFVLYCTGCSDENGSIEQRSNPYFYNNDHITLEATAEYYELETKEESHIGIEVYFV